MRRFLHWLSLVPGAMIAGCYTPAPSPDTTADVQVILEAQREDLVGLKADVRANYAAALKKVRDKAVKAIQDDFEAAVTAATDSATFMTLVKQRDAAIAAEDAQIAEAMAKLDSEERFDAALEANAVGLDYTSEISERDRKVAKLRQFLKLGERK